MSALLPFLLHPIHIPRTSLTEQYHQESVVTKISHQISPFPNPPHSRFTLTSLLGHLGRTLLLIRARAERLALVRALTRIQHELLQLDQF